MATFPQFFFLLLILPLSATFFCDRWVGWRLVEPLYVRGESPQNFFSMERPSRREKEFPSLILRNHHVSRQNEEL